MSSQAPSPRVPPLEPPMTVPGMLPCGVVQAWRTEKSMGNRWVYGIDVENPRGMLVFLDLNGQFMEKYW